MAPSADKVHWNLADWVKGGSDRVLGQKKVGQDEGWLLEE
jgi:hypothetical protein